MHQEDKNNQVPLGATVPAHHGLNHTTPSAMSPETVVSKLAALVKA